jgi:hypothetical protein
MWKYTLLVLVLFICIMVVLLGLQMVVRNGGFTLTHEDFADAGNNSDDLQCNDCINYFSDAASLNDPSLLPAYAQSQAALLTTALDGLAGFMKDKNKFCDVPPNDLKSYTTCLYNYMQKNVQAKCLVDGTGADAINGKNKVKCTIIQTLVDDILDKATVCTADCDDNKKYPLLDERLQCKATGQCKSIAELEANIRKYIDQTRAAVLQCKIRLMDPTSTCSKYFAKLIGIRSDSAKSLAAKDNIKMPQLSAMYGVSDFDTSTLVLANQA